MIETEQGKKTIRVRYSCSLYPVCKWNHLADEKEPGDQRDYAKIIHAQETNCKCEDLTREEVK